MECVLSTREVGRAMTEGAGECDCGEWEDCESCGGDGVDAWGGTCLECGGTGSVAVEEREHAGNSRTDGGDGTRSNGH